MARSEGGGTGHWLVLCALGGFLVGCLDAEAVPEGAPTLTARHDTLVGRHVLTGELRAVRADRIIVPRTPVWRVPVRWIETDGAWVEQGAKVLELDNSQFTGELTQKELAAARAASALAQKRADAARSLAEKEFAFEEKRILLVKAEIETEVPAELRALRDYQEDQLALARARAEHEKARSDLDANRRALDAELEELRIDLERAREDIATARAAIENLTLLAPRSGIFVVAENRDEGRKFQTGDNVWVGLAVASIPDLESMKVTASLSDVDDGKIHPGQRVRCYLDIDPEHGFEGEVAEITPVAQEPRSRSMRRAFRVEIRLDRSDPDLMRPGMSARVEVLGAPEEGVVVPRGALDWTGPTPRVRLLDGGTADVELGPCNPQECLVREGLEPGRRLRSAT